MLVVLLANLMILPVSIAFFNADFSLPWIIFNCFSDTVSLEIWAKAIGFYGPTKGPLATCATASIGICFIDFYNRFGLQLPHW